MTVSTFSYKSIVCIIIAEYRDISKCYLLQLKTNRYSFTEIGLMTFFPVFRFLWKSRNLNNKFFIPVFIYYSSMVSFLFYLFFLFTFCNNLWFAYIVFMFTEKKPTRTEKTNIVDKMHPEHWLLLNFFAFFVRITISTWFKFVWKTIYAISMWRYDRNEEIHIICFINILEIWYFWENFNFLLFVWLI